MRTEALKRLVDHGSESNAYHPAVHGRLGSGDEDFQIEVLGRGTATLGASRLAHTRALRLADLIASSTASASFSTDTAMAVAVFPEQVTLVVEELDWQPATNLDPRLAKEIEDLADIFSVEPVEDGINHLGEQDLAGIVQKYGAETFVNALGAISLPAPTIAALIRLFARLPPPPKTVCLQIVEHAISSESVEVRDAIVQAVELWEDGDAAKIIGEHQETVPWLAEYIRAVVSEIRG